MQEQVRKAFEEAVAEVLGQARSFHAYSPELDRDLFATCGGLDLSVHVPDEGDGQTVYLRVRVELVEVVDG